jgi:hypothetical protein
VLFIQQLEQRDGVGLAFVQLPLDGSEKALAR